ncbi:MAG: hypothetical protein KJ559_00060 [Nanoarchaeota archaeon]|nr:hypothetical protein [Nanoarchaeota archaeon]
MKKTGNFWLLNFRKKFKMKKEVLVFIFVIVLCSGIVNASLGISPAKIEINFQPSLKQEYSYSVNSGNPEQKLEIYAKGEFADYVSFDKEELIGGGGFIVSLNLPKNIEKPGKHAIIIGVKEKVDEELGGGIGVSIAVQAVIYLNVPYPGRYAEITLTSDNANAGESVNFKLEIINNGKEDLDLSPIIEIFSDETKIETLYFNDRIVKSQTKIKLKKSLDTLNYNPGEYTAIAMIDYGKIVKAESKFKLGELFVNILNYSEKIFIGGIQKFEIQIESSWNNGINDVYANVSFLNDSKILTSFKTPPANLEPWQKTNIQGFFDSSNFEKGSYKSDITLYYSGETSNKIVDVKFIKKNSKRILVLVLIVLFLILLLIFLIKRYHKILGGFLKK